MKGVLIVWTSLILYVNAAPQTRTESGVTLKYENLAGVPQSTFQAYIDLFFQSYPAQCAKYNPNCPKQLELVTNSSFNDAPAVNRAEKITVSGDYAKSKPDDIGFISHEGFHSVQKYSNGEPSWITEGLATYVGNEYYLGLGRLGKYKSADQYNDPYDYNPAARFFVYLENRFPGIVKYVDSIMRNNQQSGGQFWITFTGYTVDQLWDAYVQASATVCTNGNGVTTWNNAARSHALKLMNDKRSEIANGTFKMSNGAIAPAAKNMNKLTYSCEYETAAQNYVNTCNSSHLLSGTFGFTLGFPWVVNSINESLTTGVPYYFGFTVSNQNGNAVVTGGSAQFAYDNAKTVGCGFTTTPCSPDIKTDLFCIVGPVLPTSSPVYAIGSKCTVNSQCTKPESPICDIPSGLCIPTSAPPATTPKPITLNFFDDVNFNGESKSWTGSGNACDNFLSDNFNDRVESVDTGNGCVMLYQHRDCQGESVKLDPTCGLQQGCCPYHSSLAHDCKNFVNQASSHKLC